MNRSRVMRMIIGMKPALNRIDWLACGASGLLLALCFPPWEWTFLVWIALTPMLLRVRPGRRRFHFWIGFVWGSIYHLASLHWLIHVSFPGMIGLSLLLGSFYGLLLIFIGWIRERPYWIPASAFAWALVDYARSLGVLSFSWGYAGHTFYKWETLLQSAYWIGAPGLSFLAVGINLIVSEWIVDTYRRIRKIPPPPYRLNILYLGSYTAFFLGAIFAIHIYGSMAIKITEHEMENARLFRAALIQGNFSQDAKESLPSEEALTVYLHLSAEAMKEKPDLIVWPESAITASLNFWPSLVERITAFVETHQVDLLAGAVYGDYLGEGNWRYYNRAYLFSPGQEIDLTGDMVDLSKVPFYDKMHLVPYGEWIPLGEYWPFYYIETLIEEAGAGIFQPGENPTIFETKHGVRFATRHLF